MASSRATAFAALIDDPGPENSGERAEIRKLIEEIIPWEAVKNGNSPERFGVEIRLPEADEDVGATGWSPLLEAGLEGQAFKQAMDSHW
ncbi:MAG: hypothetical protein ACE5JP_02515 [Candidatus Bipolaricaulia bacterium]